MTDCFNFCFIDNAIPIEKAFEEASLSTNKAALSHMLRSLQDEDWDEQEVRNLAVQLVSDAGVSRIEAFKHPNLFIEHFHDAFYSPEIIIFDWEYGDEAANTPEVLFEILKTSFSLIYIYSQRVNEQSIETSIEDEKFRPYKNRVRIGYKDDLKAEQLISDAKEFWQQNFSFQFGRVFRHSTFLSVENALIELGKHDIDGIRALFSYGEEREYDFKEMCAEKVSNILVENEAVREELLTGRDIEPDIASQLLLNISKRLIDEINALEIGILPPEGDGGSPSEEVIKSLWNYRLYYNPSDKLVRKGDILIKENGGRNEYALVINAECDLLRFWKSNYGFLNLIPLYCTLEHKLTIRDKLSMTASPSEARGKIKGITSIANGIGSGMAKGEFAFPFVKHGRTYLDLIGFSKEIKSVYIPPPDGIGKDALQKKHLLYEDILNGYKRIATLSEPFRTPLVKYCLEALSGCGTPDYSKLAQEMVMKSIKTSLD